ncbi:protein of unknown function [Brochothrix thermosphacta]|nr:protein of unknown function [Brochothrix thermosphacta]
MLTLLRRHEFTKPVWDGAKASTNPFVNILRVLLHFLIS